MKQKLLSITLLTFSFFSFAQSWNIIGNSGTNASTHFIGTTDNQPLILKSNKNAGFRLLPTGNVRIGLNDPDTASTSVLRVYNNENTIMEVANALGSFQIGRSSCNGCFGEAMGDTVLRNLGSTHNIVLAMPNNNDDGSSYIGIADAKRGTWIKFLNNGIARFDGKIYSKEIEVRANVWADYVFNKGYTLMSLEEVEKYITEKGHLPNIPSAEEVAEKGINLGEMDAKLLEKIEELTLYSIGQNKRIKYQEEQLKQLQEENRMLKTQSDKIDILEKQVQQLLSTKK